MRQGLVSIVPVMFLLVTGCSSTEWVNRTDPSADFAQDHSKCENDTREDPRLQRGNKYMSDQSIERCLAKKGWVLVEKP